MNDHTPSDKLKNHQTPPETTPSEQEDTPVEISIEEKYESIIKKLESENLLIMADMRNMRQRYDEDNKRQKTYANQKIIESILPVLDAMDMALTLPSEQQTTTSLLEGFKMTQSHLLQILHTAGLEKIPTENIPFNPEEHEAIHIGKEKNQPKDTILSTMQNGYKLHGRVIRTAKVSVNDTDV